MARGMAYLSPRLASAAALLLPLTLAGTPALAQTAPTDVKEDSVVLQPDKVADYAPVVETLAQANLPDRKSVVKGKRVTVRVALGGRRRIKKKQHEPTLH